MIEKASLVITMDSSPLHISVVAGTQAIGIFGSTDPLIICPKGRNISIKQSAVILVIKRYGYEVYESNNG